MLVTLDKWAHLDREVQRDHLGNLEKTVKQEEQETQEKEASPDLLDLEVSLEHLDLQDSRATEDTVDSKDRRERPAHLGQRVRRVPQVPWVLLGQWVPLGCQEREVDPDQAEFKENVVPPGTWANLDQWVHWE